jgi:perosamine synthetase
MRETIALGQPTFGDEELAAVAAVLQSGWVAGQGPVGQSFEQHFAELCGTTAALSLNNCTAALHLGLIALGTAQGDEVIVADYTFPATGHAVRYTGAEPIFADVRPDIWTVDPAAVEAAITPRTVGVIAVDAFGQPADPLHRRVRAGHGGWGGIHRCAVRNRRPRDHHRGGPRSNHGLGRGVRHRPGLARVVHCRRRRISRCRCHVRTAPPTP